jgi:hypothetical protein
MISQCLKIFDDSRGKRFSPLWRGGRDDFHPRDFHRHCDWHANSLTLIEDTDWNIFGGFMLMEWETAMSEEDAVCVQLNHFVYHTENDNRTPPRRKGLL